MITYIQDGNIFESDCKTIVNPVNCVGVMGKGLALQFKNRYPEMFNFYAMICGQKLLEPGKLAIYRYPDKNILLFPTKDDWRNRSELDYIKLGLQKFCSTYPEKGITSIAFPKLGCGCGGLDWSEVKQILEIYLSNLPIRIEVYE